VSVAVGPTGEWRFLSGRPATSRLWLQGSGLLSAAIAYSEDALTVDANFLAAGYRRVL
jgi:hypothetical protein